jgi:hypothetical protein
MSSFFVCKLFNISPVSLKTATSGLVIQAQVICHSLSAFFIVSNQAIHSIDAETAEPVLAKLGFRGDQPATNA